jgi:hypothetical protein
MDDCWRYRPEADAERRDDEAHDPRGADDGAFTLAGSIFANDGMRTSPIRSATYAIGVSARLYARLYCPSTVAPNRRDMRRLSRRVDEDEHGHAEPHEEERL